MNTEIERCPKCNGVLAIIGRVHHCVPRPRFGDVVNVPLSEMPARGIEPKQPKNSRGGVESRHAGKNGKPHLNPGDGAGEPGAVPHRPASAGVATGPREVTKPRAKPGTGVYGFRDADEHRTYMREYMRKRRAKT